MAAGPRIAYFSMEIAVDPAMPTYSGGLGVLAGDTLRSGADEGLAMIGVTLLHRKGYLKQSFDASGWQHEQPEAWTVSEHLHELAPRAQVEIEGRAVAFRAWQYDVKGVSGDVVPVLFLDTDLPENSPWDRTLTDTLYGGDADYRICQEVVLGIGGARMLRALGHRDVARYHMNEGHAAFLTWELLWESAAAGGRAAPAEPDFQAVRPLCIFTTHTPVPAGHDRFPLALVRRVLGQVPDFLRQLQIVDGDGMLNLTLLALSLSHYVNGVAKRHAEVSRRMFAKFAIDEITNGVHAATWTSAPFRALYDRHIPGWEADNFSLRYALDIDRPSVWSAHEAAKGALLERIRAETGSALDPARLTLGFARRFTPYKRADLLLQDLDRLKAVAEKAGGLQIVYGGKAHPNDTGGKESIQHILRLKDGLPPALKIVFLPNYDLDAAKLLTAGVDVWLNTPLPPLEASGTSGMKAALNGVPSLSILDGWWLEGCIEGITGWSIGERPTGLEIDGARTAADAASLYERLEKVVAPLFYSHRDHFIGIMRHAIALNGSFFNTQRMIQQYVAKAYFE